MEDSDERPDMNASLQQAQQLSQRILGGPSDETFEGTAGGGAVRVVASSSGDFEKVIIRPDVVDPDDVALLEDLVLAAVRDASARVQDGVQRRLGGALGGLGGLFGSAGPTPEP